MTTVYRTLGCLAAGWLGLQTFLPATQAATGAAASVAYADVVAAVAAAAEGDTVLLPAGNATWADTLTVTKGISLIGAGTNATIITRSNGAAIKFCLARTAPLRLSSIAFVGGWNYPLVRLHGSGASDAGAAITAFRVDHCQFTGGGGAIMPKGWCYGVVDHCAFLNCNIGVLMVGDNSAAWARPVEPGSTNAVYIEDNRFVINSAAPAEPNEQIYHQEGARSVTRFNAFDGTANTNRNSIFFDSHGNWGLGTKCDASSATALTARGQPLLEVYGNTFAMHHSYQFSHIRGGSVLVYSNALTYASGSAPLAFRVTEEEAWCTDMFTALRTDWPAGDQLANSFFWANSLNGAVVSDVYLSGNNIGMFVQKGRDYWMQAPSQTNGSPAGVYSSYSPLQHPHPLVSAGDLRWSANMRVVAAAPH